MKKFVDEISEAFLDFYENPGRKPSKQAELYGELIGAAIHKVFKDSLKVQITVIGALSGTPPPPYGPIPEIPSYIELFKEDTIISGLQSISRIMVDDEGKGVKLKSAKIEGEVIMGSIFDYFSEAKFALTPAVSIHTGSLEATTLPVDPFVTTFATNLVSQLLKSIKKDSARANLMATLIDTQIFLWVAAITFSGSITLSPAGPLIGGTATGIYLPPT